MFACFASVIVAYYETIIFLFLFNLIVTWFLLENSGAFVGPNALCTLELSKNLQNLPKVFKTTRGNSATTNINQKRS